MRPLQVMQARGAAGGTPAPTKWRIYVTAIDGGGAVSLSELEFRTTPGVAETATGGTASASSVYDGSTGPERAFNGVGGDYTNLWAASGVPVQWLAYEFPSPHACNQVAILSRADGGTFGQTPTAFDVQYYDTDSASWVTAWSVTGSTGWSANSWRTFTRP